MAQIENMAGSSCGLIQDLLDTLADYASIGQEHQRIKISLYLAIMPDCRPRFIRSEARRVGT